MGLGNDTVLSGHLGINFSWSGGHGYHGRRRLNTIPLPARRSVLDDYFNREPVKVGQAAEQNQFSPTYAQDNIPTSSWNPLAAIPAKIIDYTQGKKAQASFEKNIKSNAKGLNNFDKVSKLLSQVGITGDLNKWSSALCLFETANLSSPPTKFFNYSNIKVSKTSPYQSNPGYKSFAGYKSGLQWAKDYYRVIHLTKINGRPVAMIANATSLDNFVTRLYNAGYVGSSDGSVPQAVYLQGLKTILAAQGDASGQAADYTKATGNKVNLKKGKITPHGGFFDFIKAHPVIAGVGAAVGGLIILKAVMK